MDNRQCLQISLGSVDGSGYVRSIWQNEKQPFLERILQMSTRPSSLPKLV